MSNFSLPTATDMMSESLNSYYNSRDQFYTLPERAGEQTLPPNNQNLGTPTELGNIIYDGKDTYKPKEAPTYSPIAPAYQYPATLNPETQPWVHFAITEPQAQAHRIKFGLSLYMPQKVTVSYGQNYSPIELGFTQDLANVAASLNGQIPGLAEKFGNGPIAQIITGAIQTSVRQMGEAYANKENAVQDYFARGIAGLMNKVNMMGIQNLGAMSQLKSRVAVNPHVAVSYKSPELRVFQLDFVICPKNQAESATAEAIIHQLKAAQAPELRNAPTAAQAQFFNYPDNFIISFFAPSKGTGMGSKPIFRIAPAVMTNLTVDYTGSGQPSFFRYSGDPVQINISMSFLETVVITKKEIQNWF